MNWTVDNFPIFQLSRKPYTRVIYMRIAIYDYKF